jgi:hypothetical protein
MALGVYAWQASQWSPAGPVITEAPPVPASSAVLARMGYWVVCFAQGARGVLQTA